MIIRAQELVLGFRHEQHFSHPLIFAGLGCKLLKQVNSNLEILATHGFGNWFKEMIRRMFGERAAALCRIRDFQKSV